MFLLFFSFFVCLHCISLCHYQYLSPSVISQQSVFVYFIFSVYWCICIYNYFPLLRFFLITELFNGVMTEVRERERKKIEIDWINLEQIRTEWKENSRKKKKKSLKKKSKIYKNTTNAKTKTSCLFSLLFTYFFFVASFSSVL